MKDYAELAYEAYCAVVGTTPLQPKFEQLPNGIKAAWQAAASAVANACGKHPDHP